MITATSEFNAANAPLNKKPILALEISGVGRRPKFFEPKAAYPETGSAWGPDGTLYWISAIVNDASGLNALVTVSSIDSMLGFRKVIASIPLDNGAVGPQALLTDGSFFYLNNFRANGDSKWSKIDVDGNYVSSSGWMGFVSSLYACSCLVGTNIVHVTWKGGLYVIDATTMTLNLPSATCHWTAGLSESFGGVCASDGTYAYVLNIVSGENQVYVTRLDPVAVTTSDYAIGGSTGPAGVYDVEYDSVAGALVCWFKDDGTDKLEQWDLTSHAVTGLSRPMTATGQTMGPVRGGYFPVGMNVVKASDFTDLIVLDPTFNFNPPLPGLGESFFFEQYDPVNARLWVLNSSELVQYGSTLDYSDSGYSRVFTTGDDGVDGHVPWINGTGGQNSTGVSDLSFNVSELDGSSSIDDLTVSVVDVEHQVTSDMAAFVFEGRICYLKCGFVGLAYDKWLTLFTGKIDHVDETPGAVNASYDFVCKDARVEVQNVIFLTGDDEVSATSEDNPRTILGNPMDIAKKVLLSYVGLDPALVDTAKFDAYRDTQFSGVEMLFKITSPPDAKSFLENEIFKPLGGYLRVTNLGAMSPVFFVPLPGTVVPSAALDHDNLVLSASSSGGASTGVPEVQQSPLANVVSFRYDQDSNGFQAETVMFDDDSVSKYGQQGQQIIESKGVRSAFQGWLVAAMTSAGIFGRYGDKNPTADVSALWSEVCLETGDLATITSSLVPNRKAGTIGISDFLFQVSNRTLHFDDFTVEMTLIDASYMQKYGHYKYTSPSEADWTSASSGDKDVYMWIAGDDGKYSDGAPGHATA